MGKTRDLFKKIRDTKGIFHAKSSHSVMSDYLPPHVPQHARFPRSWDFPDKSTGVGCHFLLQGIFSKEGLNSVLLHCKQMLYHLSHKGGCNAKMGTIKDSNSMELTKAVDIKKRWQEYTEEQYNKDLHDPDNHDGIISHLEPDSLECEVKWALISITMNKDSGRDGIPVELFQILKDNAMKVLHSIRHQIWKTQQWPQDLKSSVFIPVPKKGNAKECSNYRTIALISHG